MRAREFLMKDGYSVDLTPEAGRHSYNKMFVYAAARASAEVSGAHQDRA